MQTMGYGGMGHYGHGGEIFNLALLAGVAVLGYWVLRNAFKDQGAVRRAGQTVGWVLLIGGLIGFLAGGICKLRSLCPGKYCPMSKQPTGLLLPEGHPPVAPEEGAD